MTVKSAPSSSEHYALKEGADGSDSSVIASGKPVLGISECLLGNKVRFDGGHKHNRYCTGVLGEHFEYRGFCPEVGVGMSIPREPIRLIASDKGPRAVAVADRSRDYTEALSDFADRIAPTVQHLSGYILMTKSPSCGMERVKLYNDKGHPDGSAAGIFAERLMVLFPDMPVEESGRLNDAVLRENFVTRVYAYQQWQTMRRQGLTASRMIAFHRQYKFVLMAHSQQGLKELGRMLANLPSDHIEEMGAAYFSRFMQVLKKPANRKRHTNALLHAAGYLRRYIDTGEREEFHQLIEQYRAGIVPLVVPMTMLKHYLRRFAGKSAVAYLSEQLYLQPHPEKLGLRNQI